MAELFFKHNSFAYLYNTKLMKLYRLEDNSYVEINNPETMRYVRLNSAEISREQAFNMAKSFNGVL